MDDGKMPCPGEVKAKVDLYLTHGVPVVTTIDPRSHIVRIHRPSTPTVTLREGDVMDLEPAVPGFRCAVADIFPVSR